MIKILTTLLTKVSIEDVFPSSIMHTVNNFNFAELSLTRPSHRIWDIGHSRGKLRVGVAHLSLTRT